MAAEDEPSVPVGGKFRAFSAADWERIETLTLQTREIGQMMHMEGAALVTGGARAAPLAEVDAAL